MSAGRDGAPSQAIAAYAGPVRHLYVHVPFCTARCDYCDFDAQAVGAAGSAEPAVAALFDAYVDAVSVEWELERTACDVRRLETVYVGGGTPALLGAERLQRLVRTLEPWLTTHAEVTVETNPDEADEGFAAWAASRGARVSLGVQSFVPHLRAAIGRKPAADPAAAARRLRAAGVRELSLDLIHGIPGQTAADVDVDLAAVADLAPDHVSWYELEVADGTRLAKRPSGSSASPSPADERRAAPGASARRGEVLPRPEDDRRAELYRRVVRGLERLGYRWYEVSNFARPGRRARHNVAYWRARPYLGLGAGAVSTVGHCRWQNDADVEAYLRALRRRAGRGSGAPAPAAADAVTPAGEPAPPPRRGEDLDDLTLARERLMLAARCGLRVPLADVAAAVDGAAVAPLVHAGLLSLHSGTIRLTRRGRYMANGVCVRLFRA